MYNINKQIELNTHGYFPVAIWHFKPTVVLNLPNHRYLKESEEC